MKKLLVLIFIFGTLSTFAQKRLVGFEAGINLTNITKQRFETTTNWQSGSRLALTYQNLLKKRFSFSTGVEYVQAGFDSTIEYTNNTGNTLGTSDISFRFDYIRIPVKIGWRYGGRIYGFTNLGIAPGAIIFARTTIPSFESNNFSITQSKQVVTENVRRYDVTALAEIGGGYKINELFRIYASLRFDHSLTTFSTPFYFNPANLWHYGFSFSVGTKYRLSAKKEKTTLSQS